MPAELAARLAELGIDPAILQARGLEVHAEPAELAVAETNAEGREFLLTPAAAAAWTAMRRAAEEEGVEIFLLSAFRSVARQHEIVAAKLARGLSLEQILQVSAAPGFSEHHSGCAVDIGAPGSEPLEEAFETTAAFAWLNRRAAAFGFHLSYPRGNASGYLYEPWHWRWRA
ncbi:D-alanyl-D-alanine carboxypeptidase family protein [Chromobacterium sp. IIBBL 290-4]|uniref:M15 family metallopeptidase n=1 Tax=Chromobacterium sp. IIBBL 290-4 TaxID=2953890 RepID=UPI0020B861A5|nr:M15 family metallopeptidase [Chromobacterium sp. IIBBL 290-4]UTH75071.1 M15 family metallopeptidase [Chromobacterium sp. IIBBL 290-4]